MGSQSRATDICDGCSSLELWRSSDMRGSTAPSGSGSRVSWNGGRLRSLLSLANKIARMAWAMMVRGERFKEPSLLAA